MWSKWNPPWPDFSTEQLSSHQTGRRETRAPLSSYICPFPSSGGPAAQDQSMCVLVSSHSLSTQANGPRILCCQKMTLTFPFAIDAPRLSPIHSHFSKAHTAQLLWSLVPLSLSSVVGAVISLSSRASSPADSHGMPSPCA